MIDFTHEESASSWVASANAPDTDFPLQNLPFARFRRPSGRGAIDDSRAGEAGWRIGVAIGDEVLDLAALATLDAEISPLVGALAHADLNAFMAQGRAARIALRHALFRGLSQAPSGTHSLWQARHESLFAPRAQVEYALPCRIGDYTDFYAGIHHATNVGRLFRPDNPLLPNYKWVPIGYHGRSSSIVVSGTRIARPWGQVKGPGDAPPAYQPCGRLDYELELGFFVGPPNELGAPLDMAQAEASLFGAVLLNDWSARDIQSWEYQPLGPFLAKSFGTTISPWIVTMEALAPFRVPFRRDATDPQPLPYLDAPDLRDRGAIAITLEAWLQTPGMRERGAPPTRLSHSDFAQSYWTPTQMLAHHASNGCNLQAGDLLGTGTQSGPEAGQGGSLLELSAGGKVPLRLPDGEERTFLEDGDSVTLRAHCERAGARRIGFGDCAGVVLPAILR